MTHNRKIYLIAASILLSILLTAALSACGSYGGEVQQSDSTGVPDSEWQDNDPTNDGFGTEVEM